jgi:hypothetical protein
MDTGWSSNAGLKKIGTLYHYSDDFLLNRGKELYINLKVTLNPDQAILSQLKLPLLLKR